MATGFNAQSFLNNALSTLKQIGIDTNSVAANKKETPFTNSIFTLAQNGLTALEGGNEQRGNAIANMVKSLMDMLSSISFSETTQAQQKNQKNSKEIDKTNNENNQVVQATTSKIDSITQAIAGSTNEILAAIDEIEKLGGDEGLIKTAQEQLEAQLNIIEENKAILNGEKDGDKETALANIENASLEISKLVSNISGYRALIEAQNATVEKAASDISNNLENATKVIQEGIDNVQNNINSLQQKQVTNTQVVLDGQGDKVSGKAIEKTGDAMIKNPLTAAQGSQAVLKGGIKQNTGDTKVNGGTQNLNKITASIGKMGTDLSNLANLTNAVGRAGESAIEIIGQYEAAIEPTIKAIGSFENIESGSEALSSAIEEYKSQFNQAPEEGENNSEVDSDSSEPKFVFDRKIFQASKEQ